MGKRKALPQSEGKQATRQATRQASAPGERATGRRLVALPVLGPTLAPNARATVPSIAVPLVVVPPVPLQPTARPSVRQRFAELRSALADGWEIVQPIFARPLWSAPDDSATAYSFVLRRDSATRLLTVPEGRTVQRFIRERNLTVDYRR